MASTPSIDAVFEDCSTEDIDKAALIMWREIHNHPYGASCFCPAVEVLCALYDMGYRLLKDK